MAWSLTNDGFTVTEPIQYRPWYNYISNNDYGLKISHLGDAYSTTLQEPRTTVTHYDFYSPIKGRFVYVKDGEKIWSPSYLPVKTKLDKYSATHAPGFTRWDSELNGIGVKHTVFVPETGTYEIWMIEATNKRSQTASIQLFPQAEFLLFGNHAVDPTYYSWYTNSRWDSARNALLLDKLLAPMVTGFFTSLTKPSHFESSLKMLSGNGDSQNPESIRLGQLKDSPSSGGDPYVGCFQFDLQLKAGQSEKLVILMGVGENTLDEARKKISNWDAAQKEFDTVTGKLKKQLAKKEFEALPEGIFKAYLNTFFPYQVFQQSMGMVRGEYRGFRDVAQDAMGLVYFNAEGSRKILNQMVTKQYKNGRCLRQWNTSGGFNDERDFRDLPFWTPIALLKYIEVTGDKSILDDQAVWFDDKTPSTLLDHAVKGCEYALQFGDHALVKMGIGDWNDALSGLGVEGGSVWLNQFAYYALEKLQKLFDMKSEKCPIDVKGLRDRLYDGTMKYWNGEYFARGVTDKGVVVGGKERIFLLPQIWFAISGMSERSPDIAKKAAQTMLDKLESDDGLLKCFPGFDKPDATVGNLSTLTPGMAENFAVYNHSCAFAIYGLLKMGRDDDAIRLLKKLIPFYKDFHKTHCEPFVLVNFYNGGYYSYKKGEGGIPWLTGTVNWISQIVFEELLPKGLIGKLQ